MRTHVVFLAALVVTSACRNTELKPVVDSGSAGLVEDDTGDVTVEPDDTDDPGVDTDSGGDVIPDADGDGFDEDVDCDDGDASVNPDAEEVCDGIDNNCDEQVDEGVTAFLYADQDLDGFGAGDGEDRCAEDGWVEVDGDCDDGNSDLHPDADEVCDGLDNDCDGLTDDEDDSLSGGSDWYVDSDGDGYGNDG